MYGEVLLMLKIFLTAGAMLALAAAQGQTREVSGSNINGDTAAAMRVLHVSAIGYCGMLNRESGYSASNVRCEVKPRMASGQQTAVCLATIVCTNERRADPPPVPANAQ